MKLRLILIIVVVVVILAIPIFFVWDTAIIDVQKEYGKADIIFYTVQIIGALFTTFAVIVALFGKEIRSFIFWEHCELTLFNNGFVENLGATQNDVSPIVQSYDCFLKLHNNGAREISDVQILLKEVYWKDCNSTKFKRIASLDKKLYWSIPENTKAQLLVGDSKKIPLFKIYPEDSCQTPDRSSSSSLRIRIIGCRLEEKYSKKGTWKTKYQLQSAEKVLKSFECIVDWNGVWCNRLTEMSDAISAKINIL